MYKSTIALLFIFFSIRFSFGGDYLQLAADFAVEEDIRPAQKPIAIKMNRNHSTSTYCNNDILRFRQLLMNTDTIESFNFILARDKSLTDEISLLSDSINVFTPNFKVAESLLRQSEESKQVVP